MSEERPPFPPFSVDTATEKVRKAEDAWNTRKPQTVALAYTEDAGKAGPPHQTGQQCANCNFFSGGDAAYGPCSLFPGKAVSSKGWCSGYTKKT